VAGNTMTVEEVFLAVVELDDPANRTAYLDEACGGNAALRRQVENLLAAHFRSGEFLDEPIGKQLAAASATPSNHTTLNLPAPLPGVIPGYEVLGILGHGGMGVVYRARQLGANRFVALKMLRAAEHATPPERLRFQIETEAVARLQHPHIVQ